MQLAPELASLSFPDEPLATCASCAMKPRPGIPEGPSHPTFTASARCCTYHPDLPSFLVGRALRRGGPGAERMRLRLRDPDGVSALGVRAGAALRARYRARSEHEYGRATELTCPFWVAGELGCSIHADREAVCRTWHCKLAGGAAAYAAWMALKRLLGCIEETLARQCAADGEPPEPGADAQAWASWFTWCADHVDGLGPERLSALRGPRLVELIDATRARVAARDAPMPAVVMPALRNWAVQEHGVVLIGWSMFDPVQAPSWIFALLSRLDGRTPWRDALAATEVELGHPIGDDLMFSLYRRGLLIEPEHLEDMRPGQMTVIPRV